MAVLDMLRASLQGQAPSEYVVLREMAVKRSLRSAPEPDLSIVRASAFDLDKSLLQPEDVFVAVEVISPESEERDREDKPLMYATMGIPTFWLIERGPDNAPIVHEHHRYGGVYQLRHTHIGHLKTEVPFAIDMPLEVPKP